MSRLPPCKPTTQKEPARSLAAPAGSGSWVCIGRAIDAAFGSSVICPPLPSVSRSWPFVVRREASAPLAGKRSAASGAEASAPPVGNHGHNKKWSANSPDGVST